MDTSKVDCDRVWIHVCVDVYMCWLLTLKASSWIKSYLSSRIAIHAGLVNVGAKSVFSMKLARAIIQSLTKIYSFNIVCQKGIPS